MGEARAGGDMCGPCRRGEDHQITGGDRVFGAVTIFDLSGDVLGLARASEAGDRGWVEVKQRKGVEAPSSGHQMADDALRDRAQSYAAQPHRGREVVD